MKQLAIRRYSTVTPFRNEEQLKCVLCDLGVVEAFDATAVHELYYKIGGIIGAWLSEHESRDVSPVAKALLAVARHLTDASKLLSGRVSGFHTHVEIEVTSKTAEFLALDPTVGSLTKAQELISAFPTRSLAARSCLYGRLLCRFKLTPGSGQRRPCPPCLGMTVSRCCSRRLYSATLLFVDLLYRWVRYAEQANKQRRPS